MGNITFTLIDNSEKRVLSQIDISSLDHIVAALAQEPETIDHFEAFYHRSSGSKLYDSGSVMSDRLVNIFGKKKKLSHDEALKTMQKLGLGSRPSNYEAFKPDEETPYDMPKPTDKGFNLCDDLKKIDDGIVIVDLRAKEVSYLSPAFDITKGSGQYTLPEAWSIKKYHLELRATEE
jgi:hypothetical protein